MLYPSVMLVDDDAALLTALPDFLRFHLPGIRIDTVQSPRVALAKIKARPYDTVVTDLRMKVPDGITLLGGAHALRQDMPVVVLSGHFDAPLGFQAFKLGAYDILPKGVNRGEFLAVLKSALETHRLSRTVRAQDAIIRRLRTRMEQLHRLIMTAQARPNSMMNHQETLRVPARKSLASLEHAMDRLWQRARMAEAKRAEAHKRLTTIQDECRNRILKRIASEIE
jgi:DNA-binding NtrC family response regulator